MTEFEITTKPKIPKRVLKILNVSDTDKLNGIFFAKTDKIIINLNSYDFRLLKSESKIIALVTKAITHEYVHVAIRDTLGLVLYPGEEEILRRMDLYY